MLPLIEMKPILMMVDEESRATSGDYGIIYFWVMERTMELKTWLIFVFFLFFNSILWLFYCLLIQKKKKLSPLKNQLAS